MVRGRRLGLEVYDLMGVVYKRSRFWKYCDSDIPYSLNLNQCICTETKSVVYL